jgi:diacylglycerol O-acyltransferase / wax synthase
MSERPERVTPISAIFLDSYEHFGLLARVEPGPGGRPSLGSVRDRIDTRLDRSPRLRQRLVPTPLRIAPPVWVDDPEFAIEHHVDEAPAAGPLDLAALRAAAGDSFARHLDLRRPPWGLTLLGDLDDGCYAFLLRVHHVLASGMTMGLLFAPVLFDTEPDAPGGDATGWRPRPTPGAAALVALALRDRARALVPHRSHTGASPQPGLRATLRGARRALSEELSETAPASPVNGPLSDRRAHAFASHTFEDVKTAGASVPGHASVNDLFLATIAGGLGSWLRAKGLPADDLRAQIPVSLVEGGQATFGASTSFMVVDLPVNEADPLRRVERVTRETAFRKRAGADAIRALMGLAFRLPGPLRSQILRRVTSDRVQNLIVSDIPGPPVQLYFQGGAVKDAFPLMMLSPRHRLRIAAATVGGRIVVGITADPAELSDPQALADAIEASLDELAEASS